MNSLILAERFFWKWGLAGVGHQHCALKVVPCPQSPLSLHFLFSLLYIDSSSLPHTPISMMFYQAHDLSNHGMKPMKKLVKIHLISFHVIPSILTKQ